MSVVFINHWNYQFIVNVMNVDNRALEALLIDADDIVDLKSLINLKELHIVTINSISHIDTVARSLQNLQRLTIVNSSINAISSFICHSKRLKSITVCHIRYVNILKLSLLNQERKKLANPCLVSVFYQKIFI